MKIKLLFILCCFCASGLCNDFVLQPLQLKGSPLWVNFNPALFSHERTKFHVQLFYESKFGLKEISPLAAGVNYKFNKHFIGVNFMQIGSAYFKQQNFAVSYCMNIAPKINAGILLETKFIRQTMLEFNQVKFQPCLALEYDFNPKTSVFFNGRVEPTSTDFIKELKINVGAEHQIKKDFNLAFLVVLNSDKKAAVHLSIFYQLKNYGGFKLCFSNQLSPVAFQYQFTWKKSKCSIGANYHMALGYTSPISLEYQH